jgi:outer membrane protein OmpA-like peptidoglycan-associated protein
MHTINTCLVALVSAALLGAAGCCADLRPLPDTIETDARMPKPPDQPAPPLREPLAIDTDLHLPPVPTEPVARPLARPVAPVAPVAPVLPAQVVKSLRDLAAQYPDLLTFDEATGRVRLSADLTFDSGSNVVKAQARKALDKLGTILAGDDAKNVRSDILGHTDADRVSKPETVALLKGLKKPTDNQGLSEARAESVAAILTAAKVPATRISTKGLGSTQPLAANTTVAGKAQNRRVEVWLSEAKQAGDR